MEFDERVRFVFERPAAIVHAAGGNHLVVGDLHIGIERRIIRDGIKVYESNKKMADVLLSIADEFGVNSIIILGDVKDSILYPDMQEKKALVDFFSRLSKYDIKITKGNHDAHLEEAVPGSVSIVDELMLEDFAFLHGHRWPSDEAAECDYIFTGHNHAAVRLIDKNNGIYAQKAWLISKINAKAAKEKYDIFNKDCRLVTAPAFNPLILGSSVSSALPDSENINPLFRNRIFDYKKAEVYALGGEMLGTVGKIPSCSFP